jgi:heptosyltransferase-2
MWIGDFVRCHTVVRVLKARWPDRPVDMVATPLTAPLTDYMPGVRQAIVADLRNRQFSVRVQLGLTRRLRRERYGTALIMSRKWKAALPPFLAGIPERIGYIGECRFVLLSETRRGERKLPRMVDQCASLALPPDSALPRDWPAPQLSVPGDEVAAWRARRGLEADGPVVALAPGAVGPSKRWPAERYGSVAAALARQGCAVWVIGGPGERELAGHIHRASGGATRDLTGTDLREAIIALAASRVAVSNDSGLLHVAAALGTPVIGIFGPTSPWHWAPLNPLEAVVTAAAPLPCQPCHKPVCRLLHHRCMLDIPPDRILDSVRRALEPATVTA